MKGSYRTPKSTQERRANCGHAADFSKLKTKIRIRERRPGHFLPDTQESYLRSNYSSRCWKQYRRTQYKLV